MEETYVMNQCKEDLCFVSTDFNQDLKIAKTKWPKNTIVRDYILPDYTTVNRGIIRTLDQTSGSKTTDKDQASAMYFYHLFCFNELKLQFYRCIISKFCE